jgi:hypothetical protein
MTSECAMDASLPLLLIALIGIGAFAWGYVMGRHRGKQGGNHG